MANTYNIKVTGTLDTKNIQAALKGVEKKYGNIKIGTGAASGIKGIGSAAKESKGMLGEFTSQLNNLSSTIPKVAAFGVATMAVNAFRDAISDGVQAVFDMDAALTEFRKVSDISGEALDEYVDKATNLGTTVARTGREMIEAATTFKKSGFSEEDSLQLAKIASMYQNIADTQVSAAEASSFVISQMKAFNITAEDSIDIIDKTNAVANNLAVGTNDLSKAMEIAGAGLATYGNDINDMIALVTAGTEIMVGRSSQVSRGLNMVASRIVKNENALKEYGISIYDANGSLRSTYDILKDLAPIWKTMGDAQRVALGDTLAGTNQYKVLAAVMGNFDSALKAHEISLNASGSAMTENAKAIDSLQGHLNQLKAQFEALANNVISSQFIKSLLDAGANILKFANSDIGQATIKILAFTLGFKALSSVGSKFISAVIPKLINGFDSILTSLINVSPEVGIFSGALDGIAASIAAINPLVLAAGVVVLGSALATIVGQATSAEAQFDRLNSKLYESKSQLESISAEYDVLSSKSDLTQAETARLKALESQLATLKEQTAEYAKQAANAYKATGSTVIGGGEGVGGGLGVGAIEIENAGIRAKKAIEDWSNATKEAKDNAHEYAVLLYEEKDALEAIGGQLDEESQVFLDTYERLINDSDIATEAIEQSSQSVEYLNEDFKSLNEQLDNLQSVYQTLASAVDEYNQYGYISVDTLQQLLTLEPQYLNMLFDENGNLVLNTEAIQRLTEARIIDAAETQAQIVAERALMLASDGSSEAISYLSGLFIEEGDSAFYAAEQILSEVAAKEADGEVTKGTAAALRKTIDHYKSVANNAIRGVRSHNSLGSSMGYVANQAGSAAKAVDKEREALQKLQKQLQSQKDTYEKAYKYIVRVIDEQIDKLKEQREKEEKFWDDKINALEAQNDAMEEQATLEEKLRRLAESRSQRVLIYSKEEGFHYAENVQAVSEAQKELDDYLKERSYKEQIKKLEELKDATLKSIDDQIDGWENYKKKWKDAVDAYDNEQDRLAAIQLFGSDVEAKVLNQRLDVIESFKNGYISTLEELARVTAQLAAEINASLASIGSSGGSGATTTTTTSGSTQTHADTIYTAALNAKKGDTRAGDYLAQAAKSGDTLAEYALQAAKGDNRAGAYIAQRAKKYASGTTSASGGLSIVGEQGSELRVLNRGDGIIPHNLTENLMKLGQFSPSEWVKKMSTTPIDHGVSVVQQFGDISLPNVANAQQFVDELKQFKRYAIQAQNRR